MAMDREFACILLMCIYLQGLLLSFGCLWSSFRHAWPVLGLLLARRDALGPVGHFGLPRGAYFDFIKKCISLAEQMCRICDDCA